MEDKIRSILDRFHAVENQLNDPDIANDMTVYRNINKEYKNLQPIALNSAAMNSAAMESPPST